MKIFKIKVTFKNCAGRYVGLNVGGGLITDQELLENREEKAPGTKYSLYAQKRAAKIFFPYENIPAVQAELRKLGYETKAFEVNVGGSPI